MFNTFSIKNYFVSRRISQIKSGKTRRKVDLVAIGRNIKYMINDKTKVRAVECIFGISDTTFRK